MAAGVGIVMVRQLEAGTHEPRRATVDVVRRAFETAGVEFIDENGGGPGVRLRHRSQEEMIGRPKKGWKAHPSSQQRGDDTRPARPQGTALSAEAIPICFNDCSQYKPFIYCFSGCSYIGWVNRGAKKGESCQDAIHSSLEPAKPHKPREATSASMEKNGRKGGRAR